MDVYQMFVLPTADFCATAVFDTGRTLIFFKSKLYYMNLVVKHII